MLIHARRLEVLGGVRDDTEGSASVYERVASVGNLAAGSLGRSVRVGCGFRKSIRSIVGSEIQQGDGAPIGFLLAACLFGITVRWHPDQPVAVFGIIHGLKDAVPYSSASSVGRCRPSATSAQFLQVPHAVGYHLPSSHSVREDKPERPSLGAWYCANPVRWPGHSGGTEFSLAVNSDQAYAQARRRMMLVVNEGAVNVPRPLTFIARIAIATDPLNLTIMLGSRVWNFESCDPARQEQFMLSVRHFVPVSRRAGVRGGPPSARLSSFAMEPVNQVAFLFFAQLAPVVRGPCSVSGSRYAGLWPLAPSGGRL